VLTLGRYLHGDGYQRGDAKARSRKGKRRNFRRPMCGGFFELCLSSLCVLAPLRLRVDTVSMLMWSLPKP
jgi:hypothetical protein